MYVLHNELIQKRLLSEPELTLAKPTEIALAMEAAAKDTLELQGSKRSEVYMVINGGNSEPNMKPKSCSHCYSCGGTTHKSSECYFRNEAGRKCGKVGHIKQVCRSGKSQNSTPRRKEKKPNLHAFEVDDERDDDSLVALLEVNNVIVKWQLGMSSGDTIKMEFDTGSAISTLPVQK